MSYPPGLDPRDLVEREVLPGVLRRTVLMAVADGVELATDVWRPITESPVPVLVQRLPYGRRVASASVLPGPAELVAQGYAVVLQDLRGTGQSGGAFVPFADTADGVHTVEWAADLPFSTGQVVTYGFSHQGYNQVQVAARRPYGLVGIAPMMCASSPEEFVHEAGVRRWDFMPRWAAQLSRLSGDSRAVPDLKADPAQALGQDPPPWYLDWLDSAPDYWAELTADLTQIEVPVFVVAGWADLFAASTWRLAQALRGTAAAARVVIGPWDHIPWSARVAGLPLGPEAGPDRAHRAFYDFLADTFAGTFAATDPAELPSEPAQWFEINTGWRSASTWPAVEAVHWRLSDDEWQSYVSDPDSPVPATQAPFPLAADLHQRRDLKFWTSAPLSQDLHLFGPGAVRVQVASDAPTIDVIAALHVVSPEGEVRQVAHGITRIADLAGVAEVALDLSPIGWRVPAGHRVRLDISSSRWPLYALNPQSADPQHPIAATVALAHVQLTLPCLPTPTEDSE